MKKRGRTTTKHPKADLKTFGKCLGLALGVGILIFAIEYALAWVLYWVVGAERLSDPLVNTIYQALIYATTLALLLGAPSMLSRLKTVKIAKNTAKSLKTNREELGLKGLLTWTDLGLAPVGLLAYFLAAAGFVAIFKLFPWFDAEQAQDVGFSGLYYFGDRIIAFIALVVIAPVAEEIIFRGFLYGKLRSKLSVIPSMLIVSVIFGVLHGQWNVGVNVFAMSLVLCGLREITGTIYSGMVVHILKNGLAFYLLYLMM